MIAANRTMSTLPAGEPKIVRVMSPTCRARPKWAVSPSGGAPGISVERSFTVPSTLPRFDVRIPPEPRRRRPPRAPSKRGADHFGGSAQHGHGVLVEARACAAIDDHAAQWSPQRRAQNELGRQSAADLESQGGRIGPAQRITQGTVWRGHAVHAHAGAV